MKFFCCIIILVVSSLAQAQMSERCSDLISKIQIHPSIVEFLEFQEQVAALPGGVEKRKLIGDLHMKWMEIREVVSAETLSELQELRRESKMIEIEVKVDRSTGFDFKKYQPVVSVPIKGDVVRLFPQDFDRNVFDAVKNPMFARGSGTLWSVDESVVVLNYLQDAQAFAVPNMQRIGQERLRHGFLSQDGKWYVSHINSVLTAENLATAEKRKLAGVFAALDHFRDDTIYIVDNKNADVEWRMFRVDLTAQPSVLRPVQHPEVRFRKGKVGFRLDGDDAIFFEDGGRELRVSGVRGLSQSASGERVITYHQAADQSFYGRVHDLKEMRTGIELPYIRYFLSPNGQWAYALQEVGGQFHIVAYNTETGFKHEIPAPQSTKESYENIWDTQPLQFLGFSNLALYKSDKDEFVVVDLSEPILQVRTRIQALAVGASPSGRYLLIYNENRIELLEYQRSP